MIFSLVFYLVLPPGGVLTSRELSPVLDTARRQSVALAAACIMYTQGRVIWVRTHDYKKAKKRHQRHHKSKKPLSRDPWVFVRGKPVGCERTTRRSSIDSVRSLIEVENAIAKLYFTLSLKRECRKLGLVVADPHLADLR